jgi:membrane protein
MAAAISYRTIFALAPMLVVAISVAGLALGNNAEAQAALATTITEIAGPDVAEVMENFLQSALEAADTAAILGVLLLLWSSSTLFLELQRALNDIFDVPIPEEKRIFVVAIQRVVGVLWTVGIGIILVGVFTLNALVQIAGEAISSWLNTNTSFVSVVGFLLSIGLMAAIFALVFQTLTLGKIPWRAAWVGGAVASAGFTLSGFATGIYFRNFGTPTALGISGSIVVLVFLAYLLASVFLFGAEVSRSYWVLVWDRDENYLLFSPHSQVQPEPKEEPLRLSLTALSAFLIGLFLGRKRR